MILSLIAIFLSLNASASHGARPLKSLNEGNVVYYVSDANKLIYLQLPYKTNLTLLEMPSLPEDSRYMLTIYGKYDGSKNRSEVQKILSNYPNYKISDHTNGSAVDTCRVSLPNGKELLCSTPNGTGDFFNVLTSLTKLDGDLLKDNLREGRLPKIQVEAFYDRPFVQKSESIDVNYSDFAHKLEGVDQLSFKVLAKALYAQALQSNLSPDSSLFDEWAERLISNTVLMKKTNQNLASMKDLLSAPLQLNPQIKENETLVKEVLGWDVTRTVPVLDLNISVKRGE